MGKYNYMNLNQKMIRIRKKVPKLIRKRYSEDVTYDFVKLDDIYECLTPALNKYGVDFDILSERPTQMDEQGNSVFLASDVYKRQGQFRVFKGNGSTLEI